MIKCGLCGKEFGDNQIDEFISHVQKCGAAYKEQQKAEEMKKINEELEEVKRAKIVYEGLRDTFKEKYPDVYRANFPDENVDNKNKNDKTDSKSSTNTGNPRVKVNVMDPDTIKEYKDLAHFMNSLWGLDI